MTINFQKFETRNVPTKSKFEADFYDKCHLSLLQVMSFVVLLVIVLLMLDLLAVSTAWEDCFLLKN